MGSRTSKYNYRKFTTILLSLLFIIALVTAFIHFYNTTQSSIQQSKLGSVLHLPDHHSISYSINSGDTLSELFSQWGLSYSKIIPLLNDPLAKKHLTHLKANHQINIEIINSDIRSLTYQIDATQLLSVKNQSGKLESTIIKNPLTTQLLATSATITSSLSQAASSADLSPELYKQLVDIFSGTVNFKTKIQRGDSFRILYEEYYLNNKKYRSGDILLAELTNKNHTYTALKYTYGKQSGYYTADGQAIPAKYLKYPLKFKRISSPFSMHRMDPIQHKIAPHLGTDFAAHTGTPIHSIGDGTVIFKGWSHGFGKTIIIRYTTHIKALYAHMSEFKENLPRHVHKGDVIGFVGQTGWATGPHLHLGIYVDDRAVDPMKYIAPPGKPIPEDQLASFKQQENDYLNKLKQLSHHEGHNA